MYTHTYTHTLATPVCFTPVEKFMYPTDICHLYTRRDNGHNEIPVPVDKAGVDQIISYYPCRAALVTVISKTAETPGWRTTRPLNSAISNPAPRRSAFKSASRRIFERTTVARVTRLCRLMKRYVLFIFFFRASATAMFDAARDPVATLICTGRFPARKLRTVSITFYWLGRTVYTFFFTTRQHRYPRNNTCSAMTRVSAALFPIHRRYNNGT